jgi:hypothetical protein
MPSHKNRMKLTGDTHLPDVGDYGLDRDDALGALDTLPDDEVRVYADGWVPPQQEAASAPEPEGVKGMLQAAEQKVEQLPARKPWLAIGMGITLGWMLMRALRRR